MVSPYRLAPAVNSAVEIGAGLAFDAPGEPRDGERHRMHGFSCGQ